MIPKTIHYCWLSGDPMPRKIRRCMATWKKMLPGYELRLWDKNSFDIESVPFVSEACKLRKWAFAADYIRMYALYTEGGIYLDSDVELKGSFDDMLCHRFFSSLEYHPTQVEKDGAMELLDGQGHRTKEGYVSGIMIQAAVMGSEPRHPFVGDVLEWYKGRHFILPDGSMFNKVLSPMIYARVAEKYGFIYKDIDQALADGMMIYRSEVFAGNKKEVTPSSIAVHHCAHSWHPSAWEKIKKALGSKKL